MMRMSKEGRRSRDIKIRMDGCGWVISWLL